MSVYIFKLPVPLCAWAFIAAIVCALVVAAMLIIVPPLTFRIIVSRDRIAVTGFMLKSVEVRREDVVSIEIANMSDGLKPVARIWGYSIGSLKVGLFMLSDGEKAYLALSQSKRVVVVKTKSGKIFIFGPSDIERFIATLRLCGWLG